MIFKHRALVEYQLAGESRNFLIRIFLIDIPDVGLRTAT